MLYSKNRTNLNVDLDSIAANENYIGPVGAYQAMVEGFQNDQSIFEAVVSNDISEALGESAMLESVEAINESFGDMVEKIKEILKKLIEKVKGLVQTFLTKVQTVFIRDNKALVNKYQKEVMKKDLSKMKYKMSKYTGKVIEFKAEAPKYSDYASKSEEEVKKLMEEKFDDDAMLEKLLGAIVGTSSCTLSEFSKEAHEYMYEDEDEEEGLSTSDLTEIISELTTAKKTIKDVKDAEKKALKTLSDALKSIESSQSQILKAVPKETSGSVKIGDDDTAYKNKDERDAIVARLNLVSKEIGVLQTVTTKYFAVVLTETKFSLAQCRRVFCQAAAFNPKSVKENALLVEAVADLSDYEFEI